VLFRSERVGKVFQFPRVWDGRQLTGSGVVYIMAAVGRRAGVVVKRDPTTGKVKYASVHDLRRSFGTRWAKRIMPAVLQRLMRHRDIATTMRYYVGIQADDVAADLWGKYDGSGNTSGNTSPRNHVFSVESE
jgi:integrase